VRFGGDRHPRRVTPDELETIIDNIGLPASGTNLSYNNSGTYRPSGCRHHQVPEGTSSPGEYVRHYAGVTKISWCNVISSRPTSSVRS
jgi:hypothetical protein